MKEPMTSSMKFKLTIITVLLCLFSMACNGKDFHGFQSSVTFSRDESLWVKSKRLTASLGYRFNQKRYLGLGCGVSWQLGYNADLRPNYPVTNGVLNSFPIFVDYVRNFQFKRNRRHGFLLGAEAGVTWFDKPIFPNENYVLNPHLLLKMGFDVSVANKFGVVFGLNAYHISSPCGVGFFIGIRYYYSHIGVARH